MFYLDESNEPSVDSHDREERINARRIRVRKRQSQKRRQMFGPTDSEMALANRVVLTRSREQMETTRVLLNFMDEESIEHVTNVRVAHDRKEDGRRATNDAEAKFLKDKMEGEDKNSRERFEEITKKWEQGEDLRVCQELNDYLNKQQEACENLLYEKNKLILELQADMKTKDDQFARELTRQTNELDEICERMHSRYNIMLSKYDDELKYVEDAFSKHRKEELDSHKHRWNKMMEKRQRKEDYYLLDRRQQYEQFTEDIYKIKTKGMEDYNDMKTRLTDDLAGLQRQIQKMKAAYLLTTEKLEYNLQVLAKREYENSLMKIFQKRKLSRCVDILNSLRNKFRRIQKSQNTENRDLNDSINRLTEMFQELQSKSILFQKLDSKNYTELWITHEDECKTYLTRICDMDRVIWEQLLGLEGQPMEKDFAENVGPIRTSAFNRKQGSTASQILKKLFPHSADAHAELAAGEVDPLKTLATETLDFVPDKSTQRKSILLQNREETNRSLAVPGQRTSSSRQSLRLPGDKFSYQALQGLLEMVCDESGFVTDHKIQKILHDLPRDDRCLIGLDAIFTALKLTSENDIQLLARYFDAQVELEDSIAKKLSTPSEEDVTKVESASSASGGEESTEEASLPGISLDKFNNFKVTSQYSMPNTDQTEVVHIVDEPAPVVITKEPRETKVLYQNASDIDIDDTEAPVPYPSQSDISAASRKSSQPDHVAPKYGERKTGMAHANDVIVVLKKFLGDLRFTGQQDHRAEVYFLARYDERDTSYDTAYWRLYVDTAYNESMDNTWTAVEEGLHSFRDHLQKRSKLLRERDALKRQNEELKALLFRYVTSEVNDYMEIPPTHTMHMDESALERAPSSATHSQVPKHVKLNKRQPRKKIKSPRPPLKFQTPLDYL